MIQLILKLFQMFLSKQVEAPELDLPKEPECEPKEEPKKSYVDWSDPKAKISKYFTVKDATYLPSWGVLHIPSEDEKEKILEVAEKMDTIRDYLGRDILIHVWLRPGIANCPGSKYDGRDYNEWLYRNVIWKNLSEEEKSKKKVPNSPHKAGNAVDWSLVGNSTNEGCDEVRRKLLPKLEEFGIRMEDVSDLAKRNWVHIDTRAVLVKRYFKP